MTTLSLHASFVPSSVQMLGTAKHLLNKSEAWCEEQECAGDTILMGKLIGDMLPFCYQIKSVAEHSKGAIEAIRKGVSTPDLNPPPTTFADLHTKLDTAIAFLKELDEEEMESWIGRDMRFEFNDVRMDFTVENFLLSYAQPNLYFHVTTAYAIARHLGVKIGKRDFLGAVRVTGT